MATTLDQLERSEARLRQATGTTSAQIGQMLAHPRSFRSLTRNFLARERGPEVTAVLLHMALQKLHGECQELMSRALVDQIQGELDGIAETLELVARLDSMGGGSGGETLDTLLGELMGDGGSALATPSGFDELDRILGN